MNFWRLRPLLIGGMLLLAIFFLWQAFEDQSDWDGYSRKHNCVVVADKAGQLILSAGKRRNFWVPPTKTYRCDDGVEHTR